MDMKLVLMRLGVATSSMTSLATKVLVIAGAIQAQATIRRESRLRIREARVYAADSSETSVQT